MYFLLTAGIKRKLIRELQEFWKYHPKYANDLVPNIQGKYAFKERPSLAMVVKGGSGQEQRLDASSYMGIMNSYCMLAKTRDKPCLSVEWVREDRRAIGNEFPTLPGAYYLEILEHDPQTGAGTFVVDPLIDVRDESLVMSDATTGVLMGEPVPQTLRVYEYPSRNRVTDFVVSGSTITFSDPLPNGLRYVVDYKYQADTLGPFPFRENMSNNTAIPGTVIAFGRRCSQGDKAVIVVYDRRQPVAHIYGGRWSLPYEIEISARDVYSQAEIADFTAIYLLGILRSRWSTEGVEITEVSIDGESEDPFNDNTDEYFYRSNISVTVETAWEISVPIEFTFRSYEETMLSRKSFLNGFDPVSGLEDIDFLRDPFFANRNADFEVIN